MSWIKCSERMPEANIEVLIAVLDRQKKRDVLIASYDGENRWTASDAHIAGYDRDPDMWFIDSPDWYAGCVTDWQPLPEPPAEPHPDTNKPASERSPSKGE